MKVAHSTTNNYARYSVGVNRDTIPASSGKEYNKGMTVAIDI